MSQNNPLVSVIVPVYNVEKFLKQCLDSVVNQTYKNIEMILVDDGSKDDSGKICDEYAQKYSFVKVIHKENAGQGIARNFGIDIATGDFAIFFDSDDFIDHDLIGVLVDKTLQEHADVCYSGLSKVEQDGKFISKKIYPDEAFETTNIMLEFMPKLVGSSFKANDSIDSSACARLYSLNIIRTYNIRFVSERKLICEDLVFNLDFIEHANKVITISKTGYYYRTNPNSFTQAYTSDKFEKCKLFYEMIFEKYQDPNLKEKVFLRAGKSFFINVRSCIEQEVFLNPTHKLSETLKNIKLICNDEMLKNTIKRYPTVNFGAQQRIFLFIIKKRMVKLLWVFMQLYKSLRYLKISLK